MSDLCTCELYTGTERNARGEPVCERCGKPFETPEDAASTQRMLDFILSEPGDPRYRHMTE